MAQRRGLDGGTDRVRGDTLGEVTASIGGKASWAKQVGKVCKLSTTIDPGGSPDGPVDQEQQKKEKIGCATNK